MQKLARVVRSAGFSFHPIVRTLSTVAEPQTASPELLALLKKVEEVETALGAGKKVKTQYIDELMGVCMRRGQYNLVTNQFLLFDEDSYVSSDAEAGTQAIALNQPTPSLQTFLNTLACCVQAGEEELCLQVLTLFENSPVGLAAFDGQHIVDQFAEDDVRRYIIEDALIVDSEAIAHFHATPGEAEPFLVTPLVMTSLGCTQSPKSAVRLVQNLSPTKLQYAHGALIPAIQYSLYSADRADMVSGFFQTLHSKLKADISLEKGVLSRMIDTSFSFNKTLHTIVCFDQLVAKTSNLDALAEGLEVADDFLNSEFEQKMQLPQHLFHLSEWLDSTCNDYSQDHVSENGESTLFTKIGMLLLPNFHQLMRLSIDGKKLDIVFPDEDQCNTVAMALQGSPPTVWSLENAVKPLLWKELFFYILFMSQQGKLDAETFTFFLSCLVAGHKAAPTMYLLQHMFQNKLSLDLDNADRLMDLLLTEYVSAGTHRMGAFQFHINSPMKVLTRLMLQTKPKEILRVCQYLSQCVLHDQQEQVLIAICSALKFDVPQSLLNTRQLYISDKQQLLVQNSVKYVQKEDCTALQSILLPLHQMYKKSEYESQISMLLSRLK